TILWGMTEDVTENRMEKAPAESEVVAALHESERHYRQLLDAVTSYTYSVEIRDGAPRSTSHGEGCLAATGYTPEDFASDPHLWFTMVHPQDRELVLRHAANTLADCGAGPIEHRIFHQDGS